MTFQTAFLFDEHCLWHSASQHALIMPVGGWVEPPASGGLAESPESKRRFKNLVDVSGLSRKIDVRSAPMATQEDLQRVHPIHYLDRFKKLSDAGGGELGDFAPIGPGSFEIACVSAGLAIEAVSTVLRGDVKNAYSLSRPPGHHCLPDHAMGFCMLANIPIAIEAAKARFNTNKIAVIDWDVHHGNGTQHVFYERNDVLTISLHQEGCFPPGYSGADDRGAGEGIDHNINIPLMPGGGIDAYRYAMQQMVMPALEQFKPDLIIVACGLDANGLDPLARMMLTSEDYREMTRMVKEAAERLCDGRLVLVHEGGYSEAYVPFCGHAIVEELADVKTSVEDPMVDFLREQQPHSDIQSFQRDRIDQLATSWNWTS